MTSRPRNRDPIATTQAKPLLVHLLREAHLRVAQQLNAHLEPHGLARSEFFVLSMLVDQPKIRLTWLANELNQRSSNLSLTVSDLEEKKLIVRTRDPRKDRRVVYASLTTQGRKLVERTSQSVTDHCTDMCARLGKADHDKLIELLTRLAEVLGRRAGDHQT